MPISDNINIYIKNSLISDKVCRFNKYNINVYLSKITDCSILESEKQDYYYAVTRAVDIWNVYKLFRFSIVSSPNEADIVVNWVKTGRVFEGMCKFRSIVASEIRSVTIDIGLPNPFSGKIINNSTVLHSALHELGHALGLGHGIDENDVMFVPHKKTLNSPSENDVFVLKTLYSMPVGSILK